MGGPREAVRKQGDAGTDATRETFTATSEEETGVRTVVAGETSGRDGAFSQSQSGQSASPVEWPREIEAVSAGRFEAETAV